MRSLQLKSICLAIYFSFLSGCVSTDENQQVVVLERSELGRPGWVSKPIELEPSHEKWFLFEKTDIVRLELGIRQAQSSALAAHCQLIASRVRLEIDAALKQLAAQGQKNEKGESSGGLSSGGSRVVEKVIQELAQSQTCPELELKDVYWELLRRPSPDGPKTSYSVYVLLRLKQLPFDEVLAMTAESLKLSAQADVLPLVGVLRGRMSNSSERGTNE